MFFLGTKHTTLTLELMTPKWMMIVNPSYLSCSNSDRDIVADKFVGDSIIIKLTIIIKKILMERIPRDKIPISCQILLHLSERATSLTTFVTPCNLINRQDGVGLKD